MTNCGRCHTCGTLLRVDPVGDQLCPHCQLFRRYTAHGYGLGQDESACPLNPDYLAALREGAKAIARGEGKTWEEIEQERRSKPR